MPSRFNTGIDLSQVMINSGFLPTQTEVYEGNVNDYAQEMAAGTWDWNKTRSDPRAPMIVDDHGCIMAGHHRFVAAMFAGITIPANVIQRLPRATGRPLYAWNAVTIRSGYR